MIEQAPQTTPQRGQLFTVAAALVLLACLIGAAVALTYAGMDSAAIVGLLTGVAGVGATLVGLLGGLISLHQETQRQTRTIAKIDHQTNGVLDARIHHAVNRAMNAPIGYVPTERKPK
jgi:hypothetical protein